MRNREGGDWLQSGLFGFIFTGAVCTFASLSLDQSLATENTTPVLEAAAIESVEPEISTSSIIFTGDVMLARSVERTLDALGLEHVLKNLDEILKGDVIVGNFEASVPKVHRPTPSFTMTFSVQADDLDVLKQGGFTHLSLANNHTFDYGAAGYQNTKKELNKRDINVFGHPTSVSSSSVSYLDVGGKRVALVGLSSVMANPKKSDWLPVIESTLDHSDLQIVYIHWGEEYKLVHNAAQERLAKALIDSGVDLIIGHHPHVVQDIQRYGNGLVFYSLGNFIFDQYWNDDVQIGLVLDFQWNGEDEKIILRPVESKTVHVQPKAMSDKESEAFLAALAARSDPELVSEILSGEIDFSF